MSNYQLRVLQKKQEFKVDMITILPHLSLLYYVWRGFLDQCASFMCLKVIIELSLSSKHFGTLSAGELLSMVTVDVFFDVDSEFSTVRTGLLQTLMNSIHV